MQVYEMSFLILPSVAEDALSDLMGNIRTLVTEAGGKEIDAETPFKHSLAYSMSKTAGARQYVVNEAYVGWIKFEIEPLKILDLKSGVEKISEVLRFLVVKAPRKTEFTFAKVRTALEAKEEKENRVEKEPGFVEARDSGVATEVVVE